jgi:uncharacterized circularly permuted ATP-grasp superfamily protein
VLVHYVKTVVDALQGLLLKPPQGSSTTGIIIGKRGQQQQHVSFQQNIRLEQLHVWLL